MVLKNISKLEEFEKELVENEFVVVDFWAVWCPPCKMFGPIFEKTSSDYNFSFIKVDSEKAQEIVEKYQIRQLPTILLFKNGQVLKSNIGALSPKDFKNFIDENINE